MTQSILLVDDDPGVLKMLEKAFARREWEVHTANTGEGGVEIYREQSPDIVLLDLGLPDISGLDALRRIRETTPRAAVIMLTGDGDVETAVRAMHLGAENFLTKPVEMSTLLAAVYRTVQADAVLLEDVERLHIRKILERCGGNRSEASRLMGITRGTLYNKMRKYNLETVGLAGS